MLFKREIQISNYFKPDIADKIKFSSENMNNFQDNTGISSNIMEKFTRFVKLRQKSCSSISQRANIRKIMCLFSRDMQNPA